MGCEAVSGRTEIEDLEDRALFGAPAHFDAYGGNQRARLLWDLPAGPEGEASSPGADAGVVEIEIQRSENDGPWATVTRDPASTFQNPMADVTNGERLFKWIDERLSLGVEYRYRVRFVTADGTPGSWAEDDSLRVFSVAIEQEEVLLDAFDPGCGIEWPELRPDMPTRVFRDAEGQLQLLLASPTNHRMIGSDFDSLQLDCDPIMRSPWARESSIDQHRDHEWLSAVHTVDGQTIFGLVHNEYHAWYRDGCPPGSEIDCNYYTTTAVISHDAGATYAPLVEPPGHFVAATPTRYDPSTGTVWGTDGPSNLYHNPLDDRLYFASNNLPDSRDAAGWLSKWGTCMMRFEPGSQSFRYWDGQGFAGEFIDPYVIEPTPGQGQCQRVDHFALGGMWGGISYNTAAERHLLVGGSGEWDPTAGHAVGGVMFAFSEPGAIEPTAWEHRELLWDVNPGWNGQTGVLYPTFIDHASPSRNFDVTSDELYLYYTKWIWDEGALVGDELARRRVRFEF